MTIANLTLRPGNSGGCIGWIATHKDSTVQFGSHNLDNSQCDECHIMPTFRI